MLHHVQPDLRLTGCRILLQGGGEGVLKVDVGVGEEVTDFITEGDGLSGELGTVFGIGHVYRVV